MIKKEWQDLNQEEFENLVDLAGFTWADKMMVGFNIEKLVDLIEKKLKDKNS